MPSLSATDRSAVLGGGWPWGFPACDRSSDAAAIAADCGTERLITLPWWQGWGAVLVALSFPLHLLFEIPAALSGRPTDWRELTNRLLLLGGGLLFGAAAPGPLHRCPGARVDVPRPVPAWLRCAVDLRRAQPDDTPVRRRGVAIAGRTRPPASVQLLEDVPLPERLLIASVPVGGLVVHLASYHAPPGVSWSRKAPAGSQVCPVAGDASGSSSLRR